MKNIQFVAIMIAAGFTANAVGQVDYTSIATEEVVISLQDIIDNTDHTANGNGEDDIDLRAIALDSAGNLIFYTGNNGVSPSADLYSVDISGASPVFSTLVEDADLAAASDAGDGAGTSGEFLNNGLVISSTGVIYAGNFGGETSDVLEINGSTITKVYEVEGFANFTLSLDETELILSNLGAFGAQNDDVVSAPISTGVATTLVAESAIAAVSPASAAGIPAFEILSNSDLILWDESFRGGSDGWIGFDGTDVTFIGGADQFNPSGDPSGGVEEIIRDSNDTVIAWQEFGEDNGLYIFPAPFDITNSIYFDEADIQSRLSLGEDIESAVGGMAIREVGDTTEIYLACENNDVIIRWTFVVPTNANSWSLYQ